MLKFLSNERAKRKIYDFHILYTYLYVENYFNVLTVTEVIITGQNKIEEAKGLFLLRYKAR